MGFWDFLGKHLGSFLSAGTSIWGSLQNNANIDKQLAAQSQENAMTREHNLKLAKLQNQWNIAQWNNENAYNSPAAQMERMKAAGLNPDMMYGGGVSGNLSASSPSMTSGAPATPMDWSVLGSKKTVGQMAMDSLAIQQAEANVRKTNAEAGKQETDNDVRQKMIDEGLIIERAEYDLIKENINKVFNEAQGIDYSNTEKELVNSFINVYRDEVVQNMLQRLTASTKMSENALKEDIETLTMRIAGLNAENSKLARLSNFSTDEKRLLFDIVVELLKALK